MCIYVYVQMHAYNKWYVQEDGLGRGGYMHMVYTLHMFICMLSYVMLHCIVLKVV